MIKNDDQDEVWWYYNNNKNKSSINNNNQSSFLQGSSARPELERDKDYNCILITSSSLDYRITIREREREFFSGFNGLKYWKYYWKGFDSNSIRFGAFVEISIIFIDIQLWSKNQSKIDFIFTISTIIIYILRSVWK